MEYFSELVHRILSDNIKFWKTRSPLFSEKAFYKESISLSSKDKNISEETKLVEDKNLIFKLV